MLGGVCVTVRVPVAFRNKCERVTGPQPERVRSIFAGVNATRTSGTGPERDRNANRNKCEHGLTQPALLHCQLIIFVLNEVTIDQINYYRLQFSHNHIDNDSCSLHSASQRLRPQPGWLKPCRRLQCQTNRLTIVREIIGNHIAQVWIPNATASRFD